MVSAKEGCLHCPRRAGDEADMSLPVVMFDIQNTGTSEVLVKSIVVALASHGGSRFAARAQCRGALFVRRGGSCQSHELCPADWDQVWSGQLCGAAREPICIPTGENLFVSKGSTQGVMLSCDGGPNSTFIGASTSEDGDYVANRTLRISPWHSLLGPGGYTGALDCLNPFADATLVKSLFLPAGSIEYVEVEHQTAWSPWGAGPSFLPTPTMRVSCKNTFLDLQFDDMARNSGERCAEVASSPTQSSRPRRTRSASHQASPVRELSGNRTGTQLNNLSSLVNLLSASGAASPAMGVSSPVAAPSTPRGEKLCHEAGSSAMPRADDLQLRLEAHLRQSGWKTEEAQQLRNLRGVGSSSSISTMCTKEQEALADEADEEIEFEIAIEELDMGRRKAPKNIGRGYFTPDPSPERWCPRPIPAEVAPRSRGPSKSRASKARCDLQTSEAQKKALRNIGRGYSTPDPSPERHLAQPAQLRQPWSAFMIPQLTAPGVSQAMPPGGICLMPCQLRMVAPGLAMVPPMASPVAQELTEPSAPEPLEQTRPQKKQTKPPGVHEGKIYRHGHVPRNEDLAAKHAGRKTDKPITTLMLRNIPNRYTQQELIAELETLGFGSDTFDFFYLPVDNGTMSSVGYAFINFTNPDFAQKCMGVFQGHRFRRHGLTSGKIASASVAHIQGLDDNLRHYKKAVVSTAKNKQRRPVVVASMARSILE